MVWVTECRTQERSDEIPRTSAKLKGHKGMARTNRSINRLLRQQEDGFSCFLTVEITLTIEEIRDCISFWAD